MGMHTDSSASEEANSWTNKAAGAGVFKWALGKK